MAGLTRGSFDMLQGKGFLLAEIIALPNPSDGDRITMSGRTSHGDGAEGDFVFDSSDLQTEVTADTQQGVYTAPASDTSGASGAWVRCYTGNVRIRWFGATEDISVDQSTIITSAIAYCNSVTKDLDLSGLNLRFMDQSNNENITGIKVSNGTITRDSTFIPTGVGSTSSVLRLLNANDVTIENVNFIGYIDGSSVSLSGDYGLHIEGGGHQTVQGCYFYYWGDAALLVESDTSTPIGTDGVLITGNTFENCWQTSTTTGGGKKIKFVHNTCKDFGASVKFSGRDETYTGELIISSNTMETMGEDGVRVTSYDNVVISNNIITNAIEDGIFIESQSVVSTPAACDNVVVSNNIIDGSKAGIIVNNNDSSTGASVTQENIVITGNILRNISSTNTDDAAIWFDGNEIRNITISDNIFEDIDDVQCINFAQTPYSGLSGILISGNTIVGGITAEYAINFPLSSGNYTNHVRVVNNTINGTKGFAAYNMKHITLANNQMTDLQAKSYILDSENIRVSNCTMIHATGNPGLDLSGNNITVENCYIEADFVFAIRFVSGSTNFKEVYNDITGTRSGGPHGNFSNNGTPEGVIAAGLGAICQDYSTGDLYSKQAGTSSTGWTAITIP